MESRYERLCLMDGFYSKECPVIIVAGAILKDKLQGKVLLQLKLRNIAEEVVKACKICVYAFEMDGTQLPGVDSFSYLDICIPQGQEFGTQVPIYLPNAATRKIGLSFISVTLETYTWTSSGESVSMIPQQEKLSSILSEELYHTYCFETGIHDSIYQPVIKDGLFFCTCGTVNLEKTGKCYRCKKSMDLILSTFDSDFLSVKTNERKQKVEVNHKFREETKQFSNEIISETKMFINNPVHKDKWMCPKCKRVNFKYLTTCACGCSIQEFDDVVQIIRDRRRQELDEKYKKQNATNDSGEIDGYTKEERIIIKIIEKSGTTHLQKPFILRQIPRGANLSPYKDAIAQLEMKGIICKDENEGYFLSNTKSED